MKKTISILLALLMMVALVPAAALANETQARTPAEPACADCEHTADEHLCEDPFCADHAHCMNGPACTQQCEHSHDASAVEPLGFNQEDYTTDALEPSDEIGINATRYAVNNTRNATGEDIVREARKWVGTVDRYYSRGGDPWPYCVYWRTCFDNRDQPTFKDQRSFDCSGFVSRVLNDCGFRGKDFVLPWTGAYSDEYTTKYISTQIDHLVCYGTDISSAVSKAKNGDYSELKPGDLLAWQHPSIDPKSNHIIIYAGLNSSGKPMLIHFTGDTERDRGPNETSWGECQEREMTSYYTSRIMYGARLVEDGNGYTTYAYEKSTYTVKENMNLKDKPLSSSNTVGTLSVGDTVSIVALVKNSWDNIWLKTTDNKFIFSGYTLTSGSYAEETPGRSGLLTFKTNNATCTVSNPVVPTGNLTQGSVFNITGTLNCSNSIKKITCVIAGPKNIHSTYTAGDKLTTSVNIGTSSLNMDLLFNTLPNGNYTYKMNVTYYNDRLQKEVTVTPSGCSSTFTVGNGGHTHSYTSQVVAPTCTEGGYTRYTCSTCGHTYTGNQTNALGHDWDENAMVVREGSCTVSRILRYPCLRCTETHDEEIPAPGHSYRTEAIEGSCTQCPGTRYTCTVCGDTYVEDSAERFTAWSTTYPAGVPEEYIETRMQYRRRDKEFTTSTTSNTMEGWTLYNTESGYTDWGSWSDWSTTAVSANDTTQVETRTAYHYFYYKCPSCGNQQHGSGTCRSWTGGCGASIPSSAYVAVRTTKTYSSTSDFQGTGVNYYTDSTYGRVFAYISSSSPHYKAPVTQYRYRTRTYQTVYHFYRWTSWSSWVWTVYTASDTREVETRPTYRYDKYAVGAHTWNGGTITTQPTCLNSGVKTYSCTKCSATKTETVPATGHNWVYSASGATLTEKCSLCNTTHTAIIKAPTNLICDGTAKEATVTVSPGWTIPSVLTVYYEKKIGNSYTPLTPITSAPKEAGEYRAFIGEANIKAYVTFTLTEQAVVTPEPGTILLAIESATLMKGGQATVGIRLGVGSNAAMIQFTVLYDANKLELVSATEGSLIQSSDTKMITTATAGQVELLWTANRVLTDPGSLMDLTFRAKSGAATGDVALSIPTNNSSYDFVVMDDEYQTIPTDVRTGTIKIVDVMFGDVSNDGTINIVDVNMALRIAAKQLTPTAAQRTAADVNGDGNVNIVDVNLILRRAAKEIDSFPVEQGRNNHVIAKEGVKGEQGATLSIQAPAQASVGDEISVFVDISAGSAINMAQFTVAYDDTALQLVSAQTGSLLPQDSTMTINDTQSGTVTLLWTHQSATLAAGGRLMELTFKVLEGAEDSTAISVDSEQELVFCDKDYAPVAIDMVPASITIVQAPAYILGDADGNSDVNSADAALILRYVVRLAQNSDINLLAAKVTGGTGEPTSADAALILRYIVGLIPTL